MEAFRMSFLDDWKEWSTAKKAISILVVCCIGIIIVAMIRFDKSGYRSYP